MTQVRVLRKAERDLTEIYQYLKIEAPHAADRLVAELVDTIESLTRFARRGPLLRDVRLCRLGFRYMICGNYLIFYKASRSLVRVFRVLHGKRAYRYLL